MRIRDTLFAFLVLLAPTLASAQSWPTKPVHILVSSGAGGTADILARMVGERLTPMLGQPVIVENRLAPEDTWARDWSHAHSLTAIRC